ncbi:MAG: glycosyltransferase family 9 protein [Fimbriimonadaceae bacterium]|nr:glycosyltransferase family 9 protein [Fimbriimonadaceae bacterium]
MKVLLVRFSAIGDCVMAAYAATAIRRQNPDAEIVWAAETRCCPVIDDVNLANRVNEVPRDRWKKEHKILEPLRHFLSLRKVGFDYGFDFQGHSKTAICLRLARPKVRWAARATDEFARRLNPTLLHDPNIPEHEVELNMRLVRMWQPGLQIPERPIMPTLADERRKVRSLIRTEGRLVTIQTGAGADDKIVPPEHWAFVARALIAEGFTVAAIGAPGDPRVDEPCVQNLVGALTLREAMAAVAESALHLAGDTGSGHIAAAYGIPLVSVFGPTPPERYRPWSPTASVLRDPSKATAAVSPDLILSAALARLEGDK